MLLKKNQTVVRFVLDSTSFFSKEGWRDLLRDRLEEMHFNDGDGIVREHRGGFVDPWHLGTVTFQDWNRWLFEPYLVVGYRIDRRTVPKNLFDATVAQKISSWCAEHGFERAPAAVRAEIKEGLKSEWLKRAFPKVRHLQLSIDMTTGSAHLFGTTSESDCDQVRKSVFRLLGHRLSPWSSRAFLVDGKEGTTWPLLEQVISLGQLRDVSPSVPETETEA